MTSRHYPHRLTFRQPTESTNAAGQILRTYADAFLRRGHVAQKTASTTANNDQQSVAQNHTITLPHDSALNSVLLTEWQIIWTDSNTTLVPFSITVDRTGRQHLCVIECTAKQ